MSQYKSNKKTPKKAIIISKNCKFIKGKVIEYRESTSFIYEEAMKKGYEEMANINLELSQCGFQYELTQLSDYEQWLCGV